MNRHFYRSLPLAAGLMGLALVASAGPKTAAAAKAAAAAPAAKPAATSAADPAVDYSMGLSVGEGMKKAGIGSINVDSFGKGLQDGLGGKAMSQDDRDRINKYMTDLRNAGTAHNKQAAKDFLAKNGKAQGVIETASGLQYKIVEAGDTSAASPSATDSVTVQYRGRLLDGTVFDSSYDRGQPATFPVNGVIKGWQEALQLMKPGAKWQLYVAPELAYGDNGQGKIQPGSLLIFDVELLSVTAAK
jgi:FKBP-type peptidyl-prolyl cis-trans isomerase FklB